MTRDATVASGHAPRGGAGSRVEMVRQTRLVPGYRPMPILVNEDDHFDFDQPRNNFVTAVGEGASWGYFDFRMSGEGWEGGLQSPLWK